MSLTLTHKARRVKTVEADPLGSYSISYSVGDWFRAELAPATFGDQRDQDDNPRSRLPRHRLFYRTAGLSIAPDLGGGDRLQVEGFRLPIDTYEVVRAPRRIRAERSIEGYEVELLRVADLYPISGELVGSGVTVGSGSGSGDINEIELSVWPQFGTTQDTNFGRRLDMRAEAPAQWADDLTSGKNRRIEIEGRLFTVTGAVANFDVPHVEFGLVEATDG